MENVGLGLRKWVRDGGEEKKRSFGGGLLRGKILKRFSLGCETWAIT